MNVQIHPSYFRKIVLSEPFSQMIDVAAATGYSSHHVYVAVEAEINRRSMVRSARVAGGAV